MGSALSDALRAALRDPDLLSVLHVALHPRPLARRRVERHHLARVERRLDLEDPARTLRRRREVLLHEVHALDHHEIALGDDADDLALLALRVAADDDDAIAFTNAR